MTREEKHIGIVVGGLGMDNTDWYQYWSGSTTSGALSNHCSNFSTASGTGATIAGSHVLGTASVGGTSNVSCGSTYKVLCICF